MHSTVPHSHTEYLGRNESHYWTTNSIISLGFHAITRETGRVRETQPKPKTALDARSSYTYAIQPRKPSYEYWHTSEQSNVSK